jgi:hypothetical protein
VSFDVPDISITPGEPYYITLSPPGGSEYAWCVGWNNPYQKGGSSNMPHDWCFRTYVEESENNRPVVNITYPDDGDTVMDNITISGVAHDADGDYTIDWVMVKIDDGSWFFADGTVSWSYIWDTTLVDDGFHTISAIASDGSLQSFVDSVSVFVDNEEGPVGNPDLVITDIWNEGDVIFYQIRNIGNDSISGGYNVVLSVDDVFMESYVVDEFLDSGERFSSSFMYSWDCSDLNDSIKLFVDYDDVVNESDESNNMREEFWNCDTSDPEITFGPVVTDISQDSATIRWSTDEECDSKVLFDSDAFEYDRMVSDDEYVLDHSIILNDLEAGVTYHYMVESCDRCGNMFCSRDYSFETLPQADSINPSVSLFVPDNLSGNSIIRAEVIDDKIVDRAELYIDDDHIGNDYAYPYEWVVDASKHDEGDHHIFVKAYDESGNQDIIFEDIPVITTVSGCDYFKVIIEPPFPDEPLKNEVYYSWDIKFRIEIPFFSYLIKSWNLSIDNIVVMEDPDVTYNKFLLERREFYHRRIILNKNYLWDLSSVIDGKHEIKVIAVDTQGNICQVTRTVRKIDMPLFNLAVSRDVDVFDNYVHVAISIRNNEDIPISDITIFDQCTGFQLASTSFLTDYRFDVQSKTMHYELTETGSHDWFIIRYYLVPTLYHPIPFDDPDSFIIGNFISNPPLIKISYKVSGKIYEGYYPCNSETYNLEDVVSSNCNYIIVTNPQKLFNEYDDSQIDILLQNMADLAFKRNAVLGYFPSNYDSKEEIRNAIFDWDQHILDLKYILLIGETEIIPSATYRDWPLLTSAFPMVEYSDFYYAWKSGEFYRIGRIIGDTALSLIGHIESNIDEKFNRDDAFLISGTDPHRDDFKRDINNLEGDLRTNGWREISVLHWSKHKNSALQDFEDNLTSGYVKDLIHFAGHGNQLEWIPGIDLTDSFNPPDINLRGGNPFVFSRGCVTGDYEGDYDMLNIAEKFIDQGAAVFIGPTEPSPHCVNHRALEWFFDHWGSTDTIGRTFTNLKKDLWQNRGDYEDYWCCEYNLYGDPKYGINPSFINNYSVESQKTSINIMQEPPSKLEILVPDYETITYNETDYIEIPEGEILLDEEGRPLVPYYRYFFDFPNEYQIHDIILRERSGLTKTTGLNLPITIFSQDENITIEMKDGWYPYPEMKYSWRVSQNDDYMTLNIDIYPFYYNPDTTNAEFYNYYEFDIDYVKSDVTIKLLSVNNGVNKTGDTIIIDMLINNAGIKQDIILGTQIKSITERNVYYLPLRTLKDLSGNCTNALIIDTIDFKSGTYSVEVTLYDIFGNTLETESDFIYLITPLFDIQTLYGGFGISAIVENTDTENITDIHWSITVDGNMVFLGGYKEGNIPMLEPDETFEIKSGLLLGVGPVDITVNVAGVKKTISCFLLGPFVLNIREI